MGDYTHLHFFTAKTQRRKEICAPLRLGAFVVKWV